MLNKSECAGLWTTLVCFAGASVFARPANQTAPTIRDGVYTQAQARSGKKTYNEKCSSCHLESLEGGTNESPALKGDDFISHWDGQPLRALYSRIISTMPSNDPGSLSEQQTLDVLAYILQKNGFPSGEKPLQLPDELNKIRFKRAK
jgi:cytochrome c